MRVLSVCFAIIPVFLSAEWYSPESLLNHFRFDIPAKYLYARYREKGYQTDWGKEVYLEHLRVWNGFNEILNPGKNLAASFLSDFDQLLDSIKINGFNAKHVVPIGKHAILNGAHRLTACLLYGQHIFAKRQAVPGQEIVTADYFKKLGLSEQYLDAMAIQYIDLKPNTFIAILFPAAQGNQDAKILEIFSSAGSVVYTKDIYLESNAPFLLMKHLYEGEAWLGNEGNNFAGADSKARLCFPRGAGFCRVYLIEGSIKEVVKCKTKIRNLFMSGSYSKDPYAANHFMHINDLWQETKAIGCLLFNQNGINFLNTARKVNFRKFNGLLARYKKWLAQFKDKSEEFCIDGSSVLSVYGLREGADLDFLHHGHAHLDDREVLPLINSHTGELKYHVYALDDIIFNPANHFHYLGIKFAAPHVIKELKLNRKEAKDYRDIALLESL